MNMGEPEKIHRNDDTPQLDEIEISAGHDLTLLIAALNHAIDERSILQSNYTPRTTKHDRKLT